jgi:CreA protein
MRRIPAKLLSALSFGFLLSVIAGLSPAKAEEVGRVGVDWIGNDIIIEAIEDPKVQGITCHLAYFERSIIDRLQQGNWFEDPSNASIDCTATGPITIGDIDLSRDGEEVFNERRSIIIKTLAVNRIYDAQNDALIYLVHSREFQQGSAKMSIGAVPLAPLDVTWTNGRPGGE